MAVDEVPYSQAQQKMIEIFVANREGVSIYHNPLEAGLVVCGSAAVLAWPLVFSLEPAKVFADSLLASYDELPEPAVMLNTGTWTWAWMEPLIGTASFSILCLQLVRSQMKKLALKP